MNWLKNILRIKPDYDIRYASPVDFNDEEGRELILERRRMLLPIFKKIWSKEARGLEQKLQSILINSIPVNISIEKRIMEYEYQAREINKKPITNLSDRLRTQILAKIEELKFIRELIEKERAKQ